MLDPSRPISNDLQEMVERELDPGERIRWIDQPIPHFFSRESVAFFLIGIPCTAFAAFWMYSAASAFSRNSAFNYVFPIVGIPFLLIGFVLLFSPLFRYRVCLRTAYAITNRRALIVIGGRTLRVTSFRPAQFGDLVRRERRDGSGDIIISRELIAHRHGERVEEHGFFRVRNAKEVQTMLRRLAEEETKDKTRV